MTEVQSYTVKFVVRKSYLDESSDCKIIRRRIYVVLQNTNNTDNYDNNNYYFKDATYSSAVGDHTYEHYWSWLQHVLSRPFHRASTLRMYSKAHALYTFYQPALLCHIFFNLFHVEIK